MFSKEVQDRIRDEFSSLGDVVFLSASFTTMPPRCVQDVLPAYTRKYLATLSNEEWEKWTGEEHAVCRREIAGLLGCDEDEIALTKNTTEGIGIIASGYPWTPGKNIVLPQAEHAASLHSWIPLTEKGIELRPVIPADPAHGITADEIIAATDENTEAVLTSIIQFWDGAFIDMEKLGRYCRDKGILLVVDAIQAVGRMKVDVRKWNIDFLACGGHKGLLSMDCSGGILYCRRGLEKKITPPYNGMDGTTTRSHIEEPGGCVLHYREGARKLEGGSSNTLGAMMFAEACRFIDSIGIAEIEAHILGLEDILLEKLGDLRQIRVAGDKRSGIVMLDFAPEERDRVIGILNRYKINATVRADNVRFCISMVNREEHMDILAKAIEEIRN